MSENNQMYYPTINQSFGLLGIMLLISIPASLPLVFLAMLKSVWDIDSLKSFGLMIAYGITFLWIIKLAKNRINEQGLWIPKWKTSKVSLGAIGLFLLITIGTMLIIDPLTELIPMPEWFMNMMKEMMQPNVFSFISIVILAPFFEELLFRGIILEGFLRNYSPTKAILWSAAIFGLAHMNPWQTIGASLAGVLIGWAYYKTNSLIPGIIIHFFNNLTGFLIMVLAGNENYYLSDIIENRWAYVGVMTVAIVAIIIGVKLIEKTANIKWHEDYEKAPPLPLV